MRQVVVELSEAQMRALETSARSKQARPEDLIAEQLRPLVPDASATVTVFVRQYTRYRASRSQSEVREHHIPYGLIMRSPSPHPAKLPQPAIKAVDCGEDADRRKNILQRTAGIWKDRQDTPKDGLQYQLEARSEWG